MSREFKQSVVVSAQTVDQDSLDILAAAEKSTVGKYPPTLVRTKKVPRNGLRANRLNAADRVDQNRTRFGDWERNGRCFDF